jgi:hypothetical protein
MHLSQQAARDALTHIVKELFNCEDDTVVPKVLAGNGIECVNDLLSLENDQFAALSFTDADGNTLSFRPHEGNLLKILQSYNSYRSNLGLPIDNDWISITGDDFDAFRTSPNYLPIGPPPSASGSTATQTRARDPLADFRKGIRCDQSLFISLKDEKQWDSWQ